MSLKAKLEAVIYAAEEPVTLAQLAVLFAGEALEWKAARDAEEAPALPLPEEASTEDAVEADEAEAPEPAAEETAAPEAEIPETSPEVPAAEAPAAEVDAEASADAPAEEVSAEAPAAEASVATPVAANAELVAAANAEEAELEARRQERKRDRDAREVLRGILDELIAEYTADARGIEIREIAGGYRMGTKPEMHDAVRAFVKSLKPPLKLSLPALETLAVIAYKQPVTAPEVGEIRGVDSAGVLGSLMSRKLIATAGRKQVVGRPMLYKTTKEFLLRFGLKDISELPSMEEFEKMAAQELSEDVVDEAAAQTGDLFAESETATVPEGGEANAEAANAEEASADETSSDETSSEEAGMESAATEPTVSEPAAAEEASNEDESLPAEESSPVEATAEEPAQEPEAEKEQETEATEVQP